VAAYLLNANPHLARSLRFRARRWTVQSWKPADGLIASTEAGRAAIAAHAPGQRSFSPTALEQLAQCPYRFALKTIARLEPREQPEAIETLGPLERGSLIHDVQFELLGELRDAGLLPVTSLESVRDRVDAVLARVAARYRDDLCPAIDRVWDDGIATIGADVREWVRRMAEQPEWIPRRFELAFGPVRGGARDPASRPEPVVLDLGISLRGSIDLVEEHASGALRATDYKTGIARVKPGAIVHKGQSLQPVLYALVLERLFAPALVEGGRLYYCTTKGEFRTVDVALGDEARAAARTLVDALVERFDQAAFPAAPEKDACTYCDFRPICGPYELLRTRPKLAHQPLVQLAKLRSLP
jgi:RecB family exonuclease